MNWADWVILAMVAISSLMSLRRGFVKEALSLLTWVAAFVVARLFTNQLSTLLVEHIQTPSARVAAAFLILFVATLFAGALLNNLIGLLIKATGLSGTDRVLGMAFGIARGGVLVVVLVALLGMTPVIEDPWWRDSTLIPHFVMMETWTQNLARDTAQAIMNIGP